MSNLSDAPAGPPRRQRIGAYAVVRRGAAGIEEMLLTRLSPRAGGAGSWTLPGGGIEHGEDPRDAVLREVYEETGLHVVPGQVYDVRSVHHRGPRGGDGPLEDYHAVQVVFEAALEPVSVGVEPHVTEVDGTTDAARWVALGDLADLDLVPLVRATLAWLEARRTPPPTGDIEARLGPA